MTAGPFCILQAEDSLGDAELTRLALSESTVQHDLFHVREAPTRTPGGFRVGTAVLPGPPRVAG